MVPTQRADTCMRRVLTAPLARRALSQLVDPQLKAPRSRLRLICAPMQASTTLAPDPHAAVYTIDGSD